MAAESIRRALFGCAALAAATCAHPEGLLVASAVSLREPMTQIAAACRRASSEERVDLDFGASSLLAAQIRAGAPVDVLVSADDRIVDALARDGLVEPRDRVILASNRLVVIATPELAPALAGPADLLRPEVRRLALAAPEVPSGRYAREWLGARGLLAALAPRVLQTEDARATLAAVEAGHADAAVVYATDARRAGSARLAFAVPDPEQPRIVYAAARVRSSRRPEAAARFLACLRSAETARILAQAGFQRPPG